MPRAATVLPDIRDQTVRQRRGDQELRYAVGSSPRSKVKESIRGL